jgi:CheY-like chemotaxis protein
MIGTDRQRCAYPVSRGLREGAVTPHLQDLAIRALSNGDAAGASLTRIYTQAVVQLRANTPTHWSLAMSCESNLPCVYADPAEVLDFVMRSAFGNSAEQCREPRHVGVRFETMGLEQPLAASPRTADVNELQNDRVVRVSVQFGRPARAFSIEADAADVCAHAVLYVPTKAASAADTRQDVSPTDSVTASVEGNGQRIIVLDRNPALVGLVKYMLEQCGYRVSGYTNPQLVVDALNDDRDGYDLAILDNDLPGGAALTAARAVRAIRTDLPVVLAAEAPSEHLRMQANAAGVWRIVRRPPSADEFCAVVRRLARTAARARSASEQGPACDIGFHTI